MSAAYSTHDDLAPDDFADCRQSFLSMLDDLGGLEPTDEATLSERISETTKEVARLALEATLRRIDEVERIGQVDLCVVGLSARTDRWRQRDQECQ